MRACRSVVLVLCLAAVSTVAQAGTIPFSSGFTSSPTVTVDPLDPTLAVFKQDPNSLSPALVNDPSSLDPQLIFPAPHRTLLFDYEFYEYPRGLAWQGNTERLRAVLTDSTGAEFGPQYKFTDQISTLGGSVFGTVAWDLSPLAGQVVGIRFEMISDGTEAFRNGHLNVMNLRVVPIPGAVFAALPLFAVLLLLRWWIRRRRRAQYMPN